MSILNGCTCRHAVTRNTRADLGATTTVPLSLGAWSRSPRQKADPGRHALTYAMAAGSIGSAAREKNAVDLPVGPVPDPPGRVTDVGLRPSPIVTLSCRR